jgi:hypothetical protein
MKGWQLIVIIALCFVGLSGCSSADFLTSGMPSPLSEEPLVSAQDHLKQAETLEQNLSRLEEQVSRIDQKVAWYQKNPYLGPKRFRRDGLKILKGSNLKEIETLREKVVWHRAQASRLASLESPKHEQSLEREDIRIEQASLTGSQAIKGNQVSQTSSDVQTTSWSKQPLMKGGETMLWEATMVMLTLMGGMWAAAVWASFQDETKKELSAQSHEKKAA